MVQIFTKILLFSAILMLGFIFGVVYTNHTVSSNTPETPEVSSSLNGEEEGEPVKVEAEEEEKKTVTYPGFILRESRDNSDIDNKSGQDELKIEMEDGDNLVIYEENDAGIKEELVTEVDIKRDLLDKQKQVGSSSMFSDMGLKTGEAFEGVFKKLFTMVIR